MSEFIGVAMVSFASFIIGSAWGWYLRDKLPATQAKEIPDD